MKMPKSLFDIDPEYQPFFLSDEARLCDAVATEPEDIQKRLDGYFGERLAVSLELPVYQLVRRHKGASAALAG